MDRMRTRWIVVSVLVLGSVVSAADAEVLPQSTDWAYNPRWENPELCGKTFWVTLHAGTTVGGGATAMARLGHDRRYASTACRRRRRT